MTFCSSLKTSRNVEIIFLTGRRELPLLELMNVALNKNTVPGDRSAMNPGGVRVGMVIEMVNNVVYTYISNVRLSSHDNTWTNGKGFPQSCGVY